MAYACANEAWSDGEAGSDGVVSASTYWREGVPPESIDGAPTSASALSCTHEVHSAF